MTGSILDDELQKTRRTWLVTGVAGFIGSHLAETLVKSGQSVIGIDDFSTGSKQNLEAVKAAAPGPAAFRFIEGSIEDAGVCRDGCAELQEAVECFRSQA